jgi:hypothetical protein
MPLIRAVVAAIACCVWLVACPKEPQGGFGDGKPVKDDGTVIKPTDMPEAPPDFARALELAPAFDKEIGKPVALAVDESKGGWKVEGAVNVPAGQKKDLGALGTSMILEGNVDLSAVVKDGSGDIEGKVEAQVCTDKACDRPKSHPFKVPTA